jgi:hypothetical protein
MGKTSGFNFSSQIDSSYSVTDCVYIPESYPCRLGIVMLNRPTATRVKVQFSQAKLYIVVSSFFFSSPKIFTTLCIKKQK